MWIKLRMYAYVVMGLAVICATWYGLYHFSRWFNWNVGGYGNNAQSTVCEMVKPEYLKPGVCDD